MEKTSHDVNFKNLILDYLRDALEFFAHEEVGRLPRKVKFTPLREEQLKEFLGERGLKLDVAVKVEFPNGEREMIVFCIEHNTREFAHILKRHAMYCIKMSMNYKTDRIVPVAIFPEHAGAVKEHFKLAGDHGVYLDFRCIAVKLKELAARDYMHSKNVVARVCLPFMKHAAKDKFAVVDKSLEGLFDLEHDVNKRAKYLPFVIHYRMSRM
ncbi:MAG TPA: hypothetical protein VKX17_09245 [Planctomycetota bacterium]|nr:hypothetical protein [Planctomycetota bacterium]